jgi:hypothetical protein
LAQLGPRKKDEAVNEVRILMSIEHENLLHFREAFLCEGTQNKFILKPDG